VIHRGDIVLVSLDPVVGQEASRTRPAVVVSNDDANQYSNLITIVPMSSQIHAIYDFQVLLPAEITGLPHDSRALCEQVRAVSQHRVVRTLGRLVAEQVSAVDEALRLHLDL